MIVRAGKRVGWVLAGILAGPALLGLACESTTVPADGASGVARVFIAKTEWLDPPVVGKDRTYQPSYLGMLAEDGAASGPVAVFMLQIVAGDPTAVHMRLVDQASNVASELVAVPAPAAAPSDPAALLDAFGADARDLLASGSGVFAFLDENVVSVSDGWRVAVVLPESKRPALARLDVYASQSSTGAPLGGDHVYLVQDFFYLASVGDSAMWGNGLKDQDKFSTLTADRVESELGRKVISLSYAISGSTILPTEDDGICGVDCNGEVPRIRTSIIAQVENLEHPESMDLILLDGCGNDISLPTILNPETSPAELEDLVEQYCHQEMVGLLQRARAVAPQARIVVTGYFPFLSEESDFTDLRQWFIAQNRPTSEIEELSEDLHALAANSRVFHEGSSTALQAAVDEVNAAAGGEPMIAFADAGYGPANATFASEPWLWGLTADSGLLSQLNPDLDLEFLPADPLVDYRWNECREEGVLPDFLTCLFASVGHPNPAGARAYAGAVAAALRDLGVLPIHPVASTN